MYAGPAQGWFAGALAGFPDNPHSSRVLKGLAGIAAVDKLGRVYGMPGTPLSTALLSPPFS